MLFRFRAQQAAEMGKASFALAWVMDTGKVMLSVSDASIKVREPTKKHFPILISPLHICLIHQTYSAFFGWLLVFELYLGAMPSLGR